MTENQEYPPSMSNFNHDNTSKYHGKIFTFYSFKGGVGRTRALANVAYQLAKSKKKVLCIDFDLEAPDLIKFFSKWIKEDKYSDWKGVLDIFIEYRKFILSKNMFKTPPDWRSHVKTINLYNHKDNFSIDIIGPGEQSQEYAKRLSEFNWSQFYSDLLGGRYIELLKKEFRENYDYILIDSRTGLADIASICTVHFPDTLISVFTPSPKGYTSLSEVIQSIKYQHDSFYEANTLPLLIIPLLTRIDKNESDLYDEWLGQVENSFIASCFREIKDHKLNLKESISKIALLYTPWCAYLDDLESEKESESDLNSNTLRYKNLITLMQKASGNHEKINLGRIENNNSIFESIVDIPRRSLTSTENHTIFSKFHEKQLAVTTRIQTTK